MRTVCEVGHSNLGNIFLKRKKFPTNFSHVFLARPDPVLGDKHSCGSVRVRFQVVGPISQVGQNGSISFLRPKHPGSWGDRCACMHHFGGRGAGHFSTDSLPSSGCLHPDNRPNYQLAAGRGRADWRRREAVHVPHDECQQRSSPSG